MGRATLCNTKNAIWVKNQTGVLAVNLYTVPSYPIRLPVWQQSATGFVNNYWQSHVRVSLLHIHVGVETGVGQLIFNNVS